MQKFLMMLALSIILFGHTAQAAQKKAIPSGTPKPDNMGFGNMERFSKFLYQDMFNYLGGTNGGGSFGMFITFSQDTPNNPWTYFESSYVLADQKPFDPFIRESLSEATQSLLTNENFDFTKEILMEWWVDNNYYYSTSFLCSVSSGISPTAVPIKYVVPPQVTNHWELRWASDEYALIYWERSYTVMIEVTSFNTPPSISASAVPLAPRIVIPASAGYVIDIPFQYVTNGYSGTVWITNQIYSGKHEVSAYDLLTGDRIVTQGPFADITCTGISKTNDTVTATFTGQAHHNFRVNLRDSLSDDAYVFWINGKFDGNGKCSIVISSEYRTSTFVTSAAYDPL